MSDPVLVGVVFHSGYGHTAKVAEAVHRGAIAQAGVTARLIEVGQIDDHWDWLDTADAIVMGAPTYMGSLSGPFKMFMDKSSTVRYAEKRWADKVAAGFTNGGSRGGDKLNALVSLALFAAQHQMHWVNLGLPFGNNRTTTTEDMLNRDGYWLGMAAQSNVDAPADVAPPSADLRTAEHLGARVVQVARELKAGRAILRRAA